MTFVIRPPPPAVEGWMCLIHIGIVQESIQFDAFMNASTYIDWALLEVPLRFINNSVHLQSKHLPEDSYSHFSLLLFPRIEPTK